MPLNGSGGVTQPTGSIYPAVASTLIESAKFNTSIADIYTILASAIYKDGQQTTTQVVPFAQGIKTDDILENTSGEGVTVDGVLLKDGGATLTGTLVGVAATLSGTATLSGATSVGGKVALTADISPTQLAANTDNWAPTNLATSSSIRFSTDARRNITGLTGGEDGRLLTLHNVGTFPAVFTYEDTNSTAANRFAFGRTLGGGQSMLVQYDATTERWRLLSAPEEIGTIKDFGTSTIPAGYLAIDQDVSRTTYAALFNEVGTTWGDGNGTTTFGLYIGKGAALIAAGQGTQTESGDSDDVSEGDDTLTVPENDTKWITGMAVLLNISAGSIGNLSDDTTYYVIRNSSTTIKLASSLANAQNGTAINIGTVSGATWDITHTYTERTHGERFGEEAHAISSTENLAHSHIERGTAVGGGVTGMQAAVNLTSAEGETEHITASTGGNAAMNVIGPSTAVTRGIRYC